MQLGVVGRTDSDEQWTELARRSSGFQDDLVLDRVNGNGDHPVAEIVGQRLQALGIRVHYGDTKTEPGKSARAVALPSPPAPAGDDRRSSGEIQAAATCA